MLAVVNILHLSLCLQCVLISVYASVGIGRQRRILRSMANRLKLEDKLDVLSSGKIISAAFKDNMRAVLSSKELIQVKLRVEKKKEAKVIGEELAREMDALLAQVVGHSLLLYRASSPPGPITNSLLEEQAESSGEDDDEEDL